MQSTLNLQGDLPILYILLAILILLALLAAVGAWVRGGGLKRDEAESLFSEARDKNREELLRLENALEQSRKESAEALSKTQADMADRLRQLNEQVIRSRSELESVVSQTTKKHSDTLSDELQSVTRTITEAERRTGTSLEDMNSSLQSLQGQVKMAGDAVTRSVAEIVRQQRDQKAQSTIQLCEALITSLGTLKSTITSQISHSTNVVDAEEDSGQPELISDAPAWESPFKDESEANQSGTENIEEESPSFGEPDSRSPLHGGFMPGVPSNDENIADPSLTAEDESTSDMDPHTRDTNHDSDGSDANSESESYDRDRSGF
jgi:hypothetical protein